MSEWREDTSTIWHRWIRSDNVSVCHNSGPDRHNPLLKSFWFAMRPDMKNTFLETAGGRLRKFITPQAAMAAVDKAWPA
jgi:hypothetical protein